MMQKYPLLEIDLNKLKTNVENVVKECKERGIEVAGIIKGTSALEPCIGAFVEGDIGQIGSSRLEQLELAKKNYPDKQCLMIRIPMISEAEDIVRYSDISLNSEIKTMIALDKAAKDQGKTHKVIIMADIGDLREGYRNLDEIIEIALEVEAMDNLILAGIGTNIGCYGSVFASKEKLQELVDIAVAVEGRIGRNLEMVSGGATSSFMRVLDGDIPSGINHLRIGEHILHARDLDVFYGYDLENMNQDIFTLKCEVIELKTKETHPVGEITIDAFGKKNQYEDRGFRKRALLAIGKVDIGSFEDIYPKEEGMEVVGGSSDHLILDVEDYKKPLDIGDIVEFKINYGSGVYLTSSQNVKKAFV